MVYVTCGSLCVAVRSSCSIVSGDIRNCVYRLLFLYFCHVFVSQFGLAIVLWAENTETSAKIECSVDHQVTPYDHNIYPF